MTPTEFLNQSIAEREGCVLQCDQRIERATKSLVEYVACHEGNVYAIASKVSETNEEIREAMTCRESLQAQLYVLRETVKQMPENRVYVNSVTLGSGAVLRLRQVASDAASYHYEHEHFDQAEHAISSVASVIAFVNGTDYDEEVDGIRYL